MNEMLFTLTNHQGKRHKNAFACGALTKHRSLTKKKMLKLFSNWFKTYLQLGFYKITSKC